MSHDYDIAVIGAGIVGASLACLLAQQGFTVALIETQKPDLTWPTQGYGLRVSAINHASKKLFEEIGIFDAITSLRISPYKHMAVWDDTGTGFIEFNAEEIAQENLGYIIENKVILKALHEKIEKLDNITFFCPEDPQKIIKEDNCIKVELNDKSVSAKLLIGADGAHSWVRQQCKISFKEKPYGHTALVTTIKTEKSHNKTAFQAFMPNGPLALLPLEDEHYCSIVWSTVPVHAKELTVMDDNVFNENITKLFEKHVGKIEKIDKLVQFPLYQRHVEHYVQTRIALVGDAAHTIHPLAGQGVNLGLADIASLAEVIHDANAKEKDWSQLYVLRRYERWRKSDNLDMILAMQTFKQLFSTKQTWLTGLRNQGLKIVHRTKPVKRLFIKKALGLVNH